MKPIQKYWWYSILISFIASCIVSIPIYLVWYFAPPLFPFVLIWLFVHAIGKLWKELEL